MGGERVGNEEPGEFFFFGSATEREKREGRRGKGGGGSFDVLLEIRARHAYSSMFQGQELRESGSEEKREERGCPRKYRMLLRIFRPHAV